MKKKPTNILYLSYDGMTDALGESQVLSYIIGLSNKGNNITLISFEKKEAFRLRGKRIASICKKASIHWIPKNYTSSPPVFSTLFDVYQLKKAIKELDSFDIVHCRGYVTSIVGRKLKLKNSIPFIFDMRGFWADEKLESGHWSSILFRPVYHYFKKKEKQFFTDSSVIVSLTEVGKKEISSKFKINQNKIKTIPTCVNQSVFKSFDSEIKRNIKAKLGIKSTEKVMVYSGSLGGNYDIQILINAFEVFYAKYPDSKLLILTKTIEAKFPNLEVNIRQRIIMKSLAYKEVPDYLMIADLGFIFYKNGYSLIGRYPTKLGEYWSCSVPCLVYNKIGDINTLLDQYPLNGFYYFDKEELNKKMKIFNLSVDKTQLRKDATKEFSLEKGISFYDEIYKKLSNNA